MARGTSSAATALAITALVGCSFEHGQPRAAHDDAPPPILDTSIDAPGDAAIDAPPDASLIADCPPPPADCVLFGCATSPGSCYYYCPVARASSSANSRCATFGQNGCLVTLNDANEDACIRAVAGPGALLYVGLVQSSSGSEPSGGWGWYCGTSTYGPAWSNGEPNNSGFGGEDCAATTSLGGWVDVGCDETFRYVCEVPRPL